MAVDKTTIRLSPEDLALLLDDGECDILVSLLPNLVKLVTLKAPTSQEIADDGKERVDDTVRCSRFLADQVQQVWEDGQE